MGYYRNVSHSSFVIVTSFENMSIKRHIFLNMGIHRKYVNKKTYFFFFATNVGIHRKYVSFYSYGSFFIVTNFKYGYTRE